MRCLLALAVILITAIPAAAEKRIALVIGNDRYPALGAGEQLKKAVNDANAVGDALQRIGFEVGRGENVSRGEMLSKLVTTADRLQPGDLAFFFFAGHGVSIDGANYLLPSDIPAANAGGENLVKFSAIPEAMVVETLKARGVRVAMVVLDACRNNPFSNGGTRAFGDTSRGLARPAAVETQGIFGLYSAGFGEEALDRLGEGDANPNSVFTRTLVPALAEPGLSLIDVAYRVNEEVSKLAETVGHRQNPAYYDQARGRDVFLAGREAPDHAQPPQDAGKTGKAETPSCLGAELHFQAARELGSAEALEDHIERFGDCPFAAIARMLLKQVEAPGQQAALPAHPSQSVVEEAPSAEPAEPEAVAQALTAAVASDDGQNVIFAGGAGILVAFERVGRDGADVVIYGLSLQDQAKTSKLRYDRAVIERPTKTATGAGFQSRRASFIDGTITGLLTGHVGRVDLSGVSVSAPAVAGGIAPAARIRFDTLETTDYAFTLPGAADRISVEKVVMQWDDFSDDGPHRNSGHFLGLVIGQKFFAAARIDPAQIGLDPLRVDVSWDGRLDYATRALMVEDFTIRADGGSISMNGVFGKFPPAAMFYSPQAQKQFSEMEVHAASLRYEGAALVHRIFAVLAESAGVTHQEYVKQLAAAMPFLLASFTDRSIRDNVNAALRAFVLEPRSLTARMEPGHRLSLASIGGYPDIWRAIEALSVSLTANVDE